MEQIIQTHEKRSTDETNHNTYKTKSNGINHKARGIHGTKHKTNTKHI